MQWEQLVYGVTVLVLATPLSLGIRSIITGGRIMTRQAHLDAMKVEDDRLADRDRQILAVRAERDEWKAAFHAEVQTNSTLVRQLDVAMETARTFERFLSSFPAQLPPGGGSHNGTGTE